MRPPPLSLVLLLLILTLSPSLSFTLFFARRISHIFCTFHVRQYIFLPHSLTILLLLYLPLYQYCLYSILLPSFHLFPFVLPGRWAFHFMLPVSYKKKKNLKIGNLHFIGMHTFSFYIPLS